MLCCFDGHCVSLYTHYFPGNLELHHNYKSNTRYETDSAFPFKCRQNTAIGPILLQHSVCIPLMHPHSRNTNCPPPVKSLHANKLWHCFKLIGASLANSCKSKNLNACLLRTLDAERCCKNHCAAKFPSQRPLLEMPTAKLILLPAG